MKQEQRTLTDSFEWIEALQNLLKNKLITMRDYWLLIGKYRIIRNRKKNGGGVNGRESV